MSFREKLTWAGNEKGKASFRGASFFLEDSEAVVGRRIHMHYPSVNTKNIDIDAEMNVKGKKRRKKRRNNSLYAADLGPEADGFRITGYIIQNLGNNFDYFVERDILISALKTRGPGTLIHPLYGTMQVSLKEPAKITESMTKEIGIARFEMLFVQYIAPIFKQQKPDYKEKVDESALKTINTALDAFTDKMNTYGSFLTSLIGPITQTMNLMQNAVNSVKGAIASTINTALSTINTAISLINTVLNAPCDLANLFLDAAQSIKSLVGLAGEVVQGGIIGACSGQLRGDVTTMTGDEIPETIGSSICEEMADIAIFDSDDLESVPTEQQNNLDLISTMAQVSVVTTIVQIGIRIDFSNQQDMENIIYKILEAFDNLINRLGSANDEIEDPALFADVCLLRADFVDSMYKKNTDLAKQINYEVPPGIQSVLELAYKQYTDIEREDEIFQRNKNVIKHPGFLPGGEEIRILNE
jgi:prophage DNA circulation protein